MRQHRDGASLVEYAALLVFIAIVCVAIVRTFPEWAAEVFNRMQGALR